MRNIFHTFLDRAVRCISVVVILQSSTLQASDKVNVVTTTPVAIGYAFGRKVLGLHPVLLLGAITGSMTSGASLSIVNAQAQSSVPSLGYTGAYAFANVFLTVAGSVILLL